MTVLKEDLTEGLFIRVKDIDRPEKTHGEASDSVVDRLLLRYLLLCESHWAQQNSTHSLDSGQ